MTARTENKFDTYLCHIFAANVSLLTRALQIKFKRLIQLAQFLDLEATSEAILISDIIETDWTMNNTAVCVTTRSTKDKLYYHLYFFPIPHYKLL